MKKTYKVIIWSTGGIGQIAIREILHRPEFEIVGAFTYSKRKGGKDIGELIGQDSLGITITNSKEEIYAMKADCVLWCGAFPVARVVEEMDNNIISLLESGKNVITVAAHHYIHAHGAEYVERFEAACRKGNSSLFGTGENPGFWFERVAMTLTGVVREVESITLNEYADCAIGCADARAAKIFGFGITEEQAAARGGLDEVWDKFYFFENLNLVCRSLFGKHLDDFKFDKNYYLATEDVALSAANGDPFDFEIKKGAIQGISSNFYGFLDGQKVLSFTGNWFLTPRLSPFGDTKEGTWVIEIEGEPLSVKTTVEVMHSIKDDIHIDPKEKYSHTWVVTVIPMLQAIPIICAHELGYVVPSVFASYTKDYRDLVGRKTLVG